MVKRLRISVLCLCIVSLSTLNPGPVLAQASVTTSSETIPFSGPPVFVDCSNGGTGEWVSLSGNLHVLSHVTINDNNGEVTIHFQPQGVTGTGLTTGDTYRGTGVTMEHFTFGISGTLEFTSVNNFRIIGQGPGNNFQVHQVIHITITPDGTVSSTVINESFDCN